MQRLFRMAVLLPSLALLPMLAVAQDAKDTKAAADELKIRDKVVSGSAFGEGQAL